MATRAEIQTHRLINKERKRRGLMPISWGDEIYKHVKSHANLMAKIGKVFHSKIKTFKGGECVSGGYTFPSDIVRGWMGSQRHKQLLLINHINITSAAVGITKSRYGTFATWSFMYIHEHKPWPKFKIIKKPNIFVKLLKIFT